LLGLLGSAGTNPLSCPGRVQRVLLHERNETIDLGLARDRHLKVRKSGKPDLR